MKSDKSAVQGVINSKEMTPQEVIDMINSLTKVVEANNGWFGSERICREANAKIKELMKLIV